MTGADWIERFEELAPLPDAARRNLAARSHVVSVPAGTGIFGPGEVPKNLLLLVEGIVRVSQVSESGREIVLYRVEAGQSCVLTTACLLAHEAYTAEGVAETDCTAVTISRQAFDELVSTCHEFRDFVFSAYAARITNLFRLVDEVAFGRVDMRLADRLVRLSAGSDMLAVTHQQLAIELGTAREVISRQLNEFHRRGWIEQSRGRIALTDPEALRRIAAQV